MTDLAIKKKSQTATLGVLSDSSSRDTDFKLISAQLKSKLNNKSFKAIHYGFLGREIDLFIVKELYGLGKKIICYVPTDLNYKATWPIRTCVKDFQSVVVPSGHKPILRLYDSIFLSINGLLTFWDGATVSSDVRAILDKAESKKINLITTIISKG